MSTLKNIECLIKDTIKDTEFQGLVYAAGGYVRDELIGKESKDLDLVVDLPDGGIIFAEWITKKLGIYKEESNPVIFPRFGTAKFTIDGYDIETVMPRGEYYTKGLRKPDVFNTSLKEDAFRRDLTINSLFKNISNGVILDFTGRGLNDIENKIIITPLDPDIIFNDDPLRMLRCIRMSYQLGYDIDNSTFMGICRNCDAIKNISFERIRDELSKILVLDNPEKSIHNLYASGLLKHIIPELVNCVGVTQNYYHKDDVFYHILDVLSHTKPVLKQRLMALLHDIGKPIAKTDIDGKISFLKHDEIGVEIVEKILSRLKFTTDEINSVKCGVKNHMRFKHAGAMAEDISDKALRKFKFEIPSEDLEDVLDLMHADNISHASFACLPRQIEAIRERIKSLNIIIDKPKLPISGNDLINIFNLKPSKLFGEILKVIEDKYYENPDLTLDEALEIVKIELDKRNEI